MKSDRRFNRPPRDANYDPHVERQKTQLGFTVKRVLHVDLNDKTKRYECWHFFSITPKHNHQQWDQEHYKTFEQSLNAVRRFSDRISDSLVSGKPL